MVGILCLCLRRSTDNINVLGGFMSSSRNDNIDMAKLTSDQLNELYENLNKRRKHIASLLTPELRKSDRKTYAELDKEDDEISKKISVIFILIDRKNFDELTPEHQDHDIQEVFAEQDDRPVEYEKYTTDPYYTNHLKKLGLFSKNIEEAQKKAAEKTYFPPFTMSGK